MQTYDPTRVKLNIAGITVVGFAPGTFVKVSRNEDLMMLQMGADGIGCHARERAEQLDCETGRYRARQRNW